MLIALSAFLLALQADAAAAPAVAPPHNMQIGRILRTADGRRVGEVMRVEQASGKADGVVVIFGSSTITVPADTLSDKDRGLVTTLSYKDVQTLGAH